MKKKKPQNPKNSPGYETISVNRQGSFIHIMLTRPEVRNAFNPQMIGELSRAVREAGVDKSCRAIVVKGNEDYFCSGADLNWMLESAEKNPAENEADSRIISRFLKLLYHTPVPLITIASGSVMGGALGLLAVSDWVFAVSNSRFAFSEVKLGIAPAIIMPYVFRRMTRKTALQNMMTGEFFDTHVGLEAGLIDYTGDWNEINAKITQLEAGFMTVSPSAIREIKRLERKTGEKSIKKASEQTLSALSRLKQSPEGRYGLSCFTAKIKPDWTKTDYETQQDQ